MSTSPAPGSGRADACRLELLPIENRVRLEIVELIAVLRIVDDELLRPRTGFNFGRKHHAVSPG